MSFDPYASIWTIVGLVVCLPISALILIGLVISLGWLANQDNSQIANRARRWTSIDERKYASDLKRENVSDPAFRRWLGNLKKYAKPSIGHHQ